MGRGERVIWTGQAIKPKHSWITQLRLSTTSWYVKETGVPVQEALWELLLCVVAIMRLIKKLNEGSFVHDQVIRNVLDGRHCLVTHSYRFVEIPKVGGVPVIFSNLPVF